ncbi:MAG: hypothetical protein MJ234_00600 [bacterium]|nr:hypothetical protein [bacterium]
MKYTKEQRLDIGRRIYDGEFTFATAAEEFEINAYTARDYMRLYRDTNGLPSKRMSSDGLRSPASTTITSSTPSVAPESLEQYKEMTKEELIQALVQARITEARLKKGYEVKGDGSIIQYSNKNTK